MSKNAFVVTGFKIKTGKTHIEFYRFRKIIIDFSE